MAAKRKTARRRTARDAFDAMTPERASLVKAVGLGPEKLVHYQISTKELRQMVKRGERMQMGRDPGKAGVHKVQPVSRPTSYVASRDPQKPFQVGKTYEIVTPESAEEGEADEQGWVFDTEPMTLRETMREIKKLGSFEPDSSPVPRKGTRLTLYENDGDIDYQTGAETRNALHIKAPENAMRRLKQLLADEDHHFRLSRTD